MHAVIVYDTWYGDTEMIAKAIAGKLESARLVRASAASSLDLTDCDLLLVGSPTHSYGMSIVMRLLVGRTPRTSLKGLPFTTFDTRFPGPLSRTGSAAVRIAKRLEQKGARLVAPPESFFVTGIQGPLQAGEIARAEAWAAGLVAAHEGKGHLVEAG
jgi:flavodoxin